MYLKKNPSTASTPQNLGCTFAGVFQALALEKANRIFPNSHMTAILITMRFAASPASPVKTLSVLLLAWEGGQTIALPLVLAVVSEHGRGSKILSELSRQVPGGQLCCGRPVWPQQPQPSFAGFYSLCPIFSHSEHTHIHVPTCSHKQAHGPWKQVHSWEGETEAGCGCKDHLPETADVRIPASPLVSSALLVRNLIWGLASFFLKRR